MYNNIQPIQMAYSSGKTCWCMAFHPDGRVLNVVTKAWVTFVLGDLANYVMAYTEKANTGFYTAAYPEDFTLDVLPTEISYQQAGGSPALPDDLPAISIGQSQGSNIAALLGDVPTASNFAINCKNMEQATVQAGTPTVNECLTDLTADTDNRYNGRVVLFTSGNVIRAAAIITGFDAGTGLLSYTTLAAAPEAGDTLLVA